MSKPRSKPPAPDQAPANDPTLPKVDLSLFDLFEEYLAHGDLRSQARLGMYPLDKPRSRSEGAEAVGKPAEFNLLEKEVLIRHRLSYFPATIKAFYFGERYISTGLSLPWRRLQLSSLLRWLHRRLPAEAVVLFYFTDAEQGAVLVQETTAFHFHRQGRRYYITIVENGRADDRPTWHYDAAAWIRKLMSEFEGRQAMRDLTGGDAEALAALAQIDPWLRDD